MIFGINILPFYLYLLPYDYLLVSASRSGDRSREALYYNFTTNEAPVNGTCFVNPRVGFAEYTLYNLSCVDFNDTDLPLNYTLTFDFAGQ